MITIKTKVSQLINTSIEDMKSSLSCSEKNGDLSVEVLICARDVAIVKHESTRAKILNSYLIKLAKMHSHPPEVSHKR